VASGQLPVAVKLSACSLNPLGNGYLADVAFPAFAKKRLQQFCATAGQDTTRDFHAVIQVRLTQKLHDGLDGTSLRVVSAVHKPPYARMHQCPGAHRARFNCSKELTVSQTVVTKDRTCLAQGNHLCVGGRIVAGEILVPAPGNNGTIAHDDRAHRDFFRLKRSLGCAQRLFHEEFVGVVVSRQLWVVGQGWLRFGH